MVAKEMGITCTIQEAKKHFRFHRIEQPAYSGQVRRERLLYEVGSLSERSRAIITALYRHRVLSTEQLREVFFASPGRTEKTARWMANTELTALAARHFIYRVYPTERMAKKKDAPKNFAKQALWFLGKASVPYIEDTYGVTVWREHYTQMAREVSDVRLMHDLRANGLYVSLHRALRERGGLLTLPRQDSESSLELRPENWYGDKSLAIAFYDNRRRLDDEIRADGFATLSIHRNSWSKDKKGLPSCQMPFFLEYDHGSKEIGDVANQLLSYHLLARTRRVAERFPDLDIPNYAPPVIMVFSTKSRMRSIHKRFLKLCQEEGIDRGLPIFLSSEDEWTADALAPGICRLAWASPDREISFLDGLLRASGELIASRELLARDVLRIDLKAARRVTGAVTVEGLTTQRAKRAEDRDAAEKRERLEREEAVRTARLQQIRVETAKRKASEAITSPPKTRQPTIEPLALPANRRRRKPS